MRKIWLAVLIATVGTALLAPTAAEAAARQLTLADAVEQALRIEPLVAEAYIAEDRGKLAILRSQLDRVSLKVDGSIQELFNKSNIGGTQPGSFDVCTLSNGSSLPLPANLCNNPLLGGTAATVTPDGSPQSGIGTFNLAANLNVPIFSGFRVEANVKRAQRLGDAATVGIRQARKDTALSVARAYWAVRRLGLLSEVANASLDRLREAEAVTDGRLKAGLAPPIDKNRAMLRRLTQAAAIADLDGQLREATTTLAVALGYTEELVLVDKPEVPDGLPPTAESLLGEARGWRPELATAKLNVLAQHEVVRMAMSNFYPQLNGFGLYQIGNTFYNPVSGSRSLTSSPNPFANLAGNLTLGVSLSMNFFDTLNTYTATKDARYEEARLLEERRRLERAVDADVRLAHARLLHLYGRRVPLVAAREVARDNLTILEGRYKNGDALVIEYLDGQNDLVNAEQNLVDVTAQLQTAWIELEASLGKTVGVNR